MHPSENEDKQREVYYQYRFLPGGIHSKPTQGGGTPGEQDRSIELKRQSRNSQEAEGTETYRTE